MSEKLSVRVVIRVCLKNENKLQLWWAPYRNCCVVLSYVVYSRFTPASYFHQSSCCGYSKHTQSVAPGAIINGRPNFENTADRT